MSKEPSVAKAERNKLIREDYQRMYYDEKMRIAEIYPVLAKKYYLSERTIEDICTRS